MTSYQESGKLSRHQKFCSFYSFTYACKPSHFLLFHLSVGYDIFGSEKKIHNHLKSLEFQYECENFESSSLKKVSFVRVTNVLM